MCYQPLFPFEPTFCQENFGFCQISPNTKCILIPIGTCFFIIAVIRKIFDKCLHIDFMQHPLDERQANLIGCCSFHFQGFIYIALIFRNHESFSVERQLVILIISNFCLCKSPVIRCIRILVGGNHRHIFLITQTNQRLWLLPASSLPLTPLFCPFRKGISDQSPSSPNVCIKRCSVPDRQFHK